MASAGGSGDVSDAEIQRFRNKVPTFTVVELKGILRDFAARCRCRLPISGTKPQLINRINEQVTSWAHARDWTKLRTALDVADTPRDNKGNSLTTATSGSASGSGWVPAYGSASGGSAAAGPSSAPYGGTHGAGGYQKLAAGGSSAHQTHRVGNSGYVGQAGTASAVRTSSISSVPRRLHFKPSPFWSIQQIVSGPVVLPEAGPQTRKSSLLELRLNSQHLGLLRAPNSNYQIRLFCTTKSSAEIAERSHPHYPATVEFPFSCEARINGNLYSSSLKGSKKTPGRVPPPNLNKDKTLMTRDGMVNKIELVYTNAHQKYVMAIALCTYTDVDTIVEKLRREQRRTKEDIIGSMKRAAAEDDIEVGTSTLSLRDPLSYTRIQAPARSLKCSHSQCFDASFFFMSNEQSPTWSCPHCSQTLRPEELFIDGYFEDILKRVPSEEDAVDVDADGSWRTRDGKVSFSTSAAGQATSTEVAKGTSLASSPNGKPAQLVQAKEEQDTMSNALPPLSNGSQAMSPVVPPHAEVVLLDSDDENDDAPQAGATVPVHAQDESMSSHLSAREGGHASASSSPMPNVTSTTMRSAPASQLRENSSMGGASATDAIDLTFSDSEDEAEPAPARSAPSRPNLAPLTTTNVPLHPTRSPRQPWSAAEAVSSPLVPSAPEEAPERLNRSATVASPQTVWLSAPEQRNQMTASSHSSGHIPTLGSHPLHEAGSFAIQASSSRGRPWAWGPPAASSQPNTPLTSSSFYRPVGTSTAAGSSPSSYGDHGRFYQGSMPPSASMPAHSAPFYTAPSALSASNAAQGPTSEPGHLLTASSEPNGAGHTSTTQSEVDVDLQRSEGDGMPTSRLRAREESTSSDAEPQNKRPRRHQDSEEHELNHGAPEEHGGALGSETSDLNVGSSRGPGTGATDPTTISATAASTPLPSVSPSPPPSQARRRKAAQRVDSAEDDVGENGHNSGPSGADDGDEDETQGIRAPGRNSDRNGTAGRLQVDDFDELSDSVFDSLES